MQKIPTIFERDETQRGHPVKNVVKPECQWVMDGEGVATRKLDGMNVKIEGGQLFKRHKPANPYTEAEYVACRAEAPDDKYLCEAFGNLCTTHDGNPPDGIYEAVGPRIQGNAEMSPTHQLIRVHPWNDLLGLDLPGRTFEELAAYLTAHDIEGIVFHHPDGRMAKIKKRDFGLKRL
jgi:hypothetical protein